MIMDANLLFAEDKAITVAAASDVVDIHKGGDAVAGELTLHVLCGTVAPTSGTEGATLTVKLQTSDDNFDEDVEDLVISPAKAIAGIKKGATVFKVRIPTGAKRYLRAYFSPSAELTAGKFSAFITGEY